MHDPVSFMFTAGMIRDEASYLSLSKINARMEAFLIQIIYTSGTEWVCQGRGQGG